jgi:hypothetical protein
LGLQFLDCPHAVATKLPVAREHRHLTPSVPSRECFSVRTNVTHDAGIGAHRCIRLEVCQTEMPQDEPSGAQLHRRAPTPIWSFEPGVGQSLYSNAALDSVPSRGIARPGPCRRLLSTGIGPTCRDPRPSRLGRLPAEG